MANKIGLITGLKSATAVKIYNELEATRILSLIFYGIQ